MPAIQGNPEIGDDSIEASLERLSQGVTSRGGEITETNHWGRRRLAYEIQKNAEGIYAVIQLTADPDTVKEFDRQLGLNESVLRTKVLRPEAR